MRGYRSDGDGLGGEFGVYGNHCACGGAFGGLSCSCGEEAARQKKNGMKMRYRRESM